MWSAAILCGGLARRFGGRDKSALVVEGETILHRQLAMLAEVNHVEEVLLVGGGAAHPAARSLVDLVPGCGPMSGIHAALTGARGRGVFVLACDMPYVSAALVSYLIDRADEADLIVPRTEDRYHPLCAVYTRACLEPIAQRLAERRLKVLDLFEAVRTRIVMPSELDRLGDRHQLLRNVNTPVEYAALRNSREHQL